MEDNVRAAQQGDALAMDALLGELAPWVGRICAAITLDRGADAMQESLISVLQPASTSASLGGLVGWRHGQPQRQHHHDGPPSSIYLRTATGSETARPSPLPHARSGYATR